MGQSRFCELTFGVSLDTFLPTFNFKKGWLKNRKICAKFKHRQIITCKGT